MTDVAGYLRALAAAQVHTGAQRWPDAAATWDRVTSMNPVRGDHWVRLGEARFELDDFRGALLAYRQAQAVGVPPSSPHEEAMFPAEVSYRIATCYASLGERDSAVAELGHAVDLGLRDLSKPCDDEHWKPLLDDEQVRDLLAITDTEGMTRDDGWRADLAYMSREVKRRAYAPFAEVPEPEFDAALRQLCADVPALSDMQILAGIMRLLRPFGDGHADVEPAEDNREAQLSLPVKFYSFTEGLFVTAVASPEHRRLLGARLEAIGGRPVDELLAAVEPLISRDNDQQVRWLGPELLRWTPLLHALGLIADPGRAVLRVAIAGGGSESVTIESVVSGPRDYPLIAPPPSLTRPRPAGWLSLPDTLPEPLPLYLRNSSVRYWFEYLREPAVVYFQFNGVGNQEPEPFADFCARLFGFIDHHEVSKLVIDLRWNGGGNTFLVRQLLHRLIGCAKVNQRGSLYVIIGRGTFSAAQNTATMIELHTNAIFVGEPSGSRPNFIGEVLAFTLPYSKTTVNVSDLYWQTSWPTDHRPWIAPELYVPPAFEAFSRNADPAMEAILGCEEHLPGF
jgi:tetratricopeptide (TPR) repeat protein